MRSSRLKTDILSSLLTLLCAGACLSTLPLRAQSPDFTITPGKSDADNLPLTGAKFCLTRSPLCYQMPSAKNGAVVYQFGLEPQADVISTSGEPWYLFNALFSGGGSGTLTRYAILRRSGDHLTNLLPYVALSNVSDEKIWNDSKLSPFPLFLTADFIWDMAAGEIHFGEHRFTISVWRYNPARSLYEKVLTYRTAAKYGGGDVDPITVIGPERDQIRKRLAALPQHR